MKSIALQFADGEIRVKVPDGADVRRAPPVGALASPAAEVRRSLALPIGCPPLAELARGLSDAAVVVSDNTRPVPYAGDCGILGPIIDALRQAGVRDIKIIVGCGNHRPMTDSELAAMLGPSAFREGIRIINHVSTDRAMLRSIGRTERTPDVTINSHYLDARLKVLTGLVEPHCMAGYSGGRKAICPGIAGQSVAYGFHSAAVLDDPGATTLVMDGNPCHEEALRIARMAGADFTVNVTVNGDKRITGVFSGELEAAHAAAVRHLEPSVTIPIAEPYDVAVTQAGEVGVNHYQCVKAALEASRAVKPGGTVIMVGNLTDDDPLGSEGYREMMKLAVREGMKSFCGRILSASWRLVPDQWGVQVWARVFGHLGSPGNLYTCAPQLASRAGEIPEVNVAAQTSRTTGETDAAFAIRMLQATIDQVAERQPGARMIVLPDGPYSIPVLECFAGKTGKSYL